MEASEVVTDATDIRDDEERETARTYRWSAVRPGPISWLHWHAPEARNKAPYSLDPYQVVFQGIMWYVETHRRVALLIALCVTYCYSRGVGIGCEGAEWYVGRTEVS